MRRPAAIAVALATAGAVRILNFVQNRGGVAQLGERLLCKQEVVGSIPITSTTAPCGRAETRTQKPEHRTKRPEEAGGWIKIRLGSDLLTFRLLTSIGESKFAPWVASSWVFDL